jgi:ABC-2 type transport system permease protein
MAMAHQFRLSNNLDYLRFLLKRNRRFMMLMGLGMLVLYPVLILTLRLINPNIYINDIRGVGQVFALILLIVSAISIPFLTLGYINSKKHLDVYHALPIKRSDLLIINVLAAFIIMVIPFTVAWFVGGVVVLSPEFTVINILETWITSLMIVSAIFSIIVFTLMHTGTNVDGLLYGMVLNFLPILTYVAYTAFSAVVLLGFNGDYIARYIGLIFPIWAIFENLFEVETRLWDSSLLNGLYWLVISIVLLVASRYFYKIRKHEKAESPFTNPYFFPAISAFVSIVLIFLMYAGFYSINESIDQNFFNPLNFIFPFFFTGVTYLVMDTISQRSFKNMYKAMLRYLIIALIGFGLLLFGLFSKGFGYITKIPNVENIQSIEFRLEDYNNVILPRMAINDYNYYDNESMTYLIQDDRGIEIVQNMHKIILSEYKWIDYSNRNLYTYDSSFIERIQSTNGYIQSYEDYSYAVSPYEGSSLTLRFTYTLDSGSVVSRSYTIPYEWTKSLQALMYNEGMLKNYAPNVALRETYKYLSEVNSVNAFTPASTSINKNSFDLEAFSLAYEKDFLTLSNRDINDLQPVTLGYVNLITCKSDTNKNECIESNILINELYTNTLAYLDSINVTFPSLSNFAALRVVMFVPQENVTDDFKFYTAMGMNSSLNGFGSYDKLGNFKATYVELTEEQLLAILPFTTNVGISTEPLLSLMIGESLTYTTEYMFKGNTLILPNYMDEVLALIKDNPRFTMTDPYSLVQKIQ